MNQRTTYQIHLDKVVSLLEEKAISDQEFELMLSGVAKEYADRQLDPRRIRPTPVATQDVGPREW